MIEFGNVPASSAIGSFSKGSGSGTTISVPSITTADAQNMVISILTAQTNQSIPDPSGFDNLDGFGGTHGSYTLSSMTMVSAGLTGTISAAISSAAWEGFLIEIKGAT
jgi:hypothetical protein